MNYGRVGTAWPGFAFCGTASGRGVSRTGVQFLSADLSMAGVSVGAGVFL